MKFTNKKRGFTIVELIIVIAVIAVLAAVLIPVFSGLIQQGKDAEAKVVVNTLNKGLAMTTTKPATMQSALEAVETNVGINVAKLDETYAKTGNKILWDSEYNTFLFVTKDNEKVSAPNVDKFTDKEINLWAVAKTTDDLKDNYSHYWYGGDVTAVEVATGFDAGEAKIGTVNYVNAASAKNVTIRTNGGTLTVNAPNDTVTHYEKADKVVITAVAANSYHENGEVVGNIEVTKGRVELAPTAVVNTILVASEKEGDVKVEVKSGATVAVVAPTTEVAKKDVVASTTVPAESQVQDVVKANDNFAGGLGTEKSPYLVANEEQFANINKLYSSKKIDVAYEGGIYYFRQTADIEFSALTIINAFSGKYDGNGHTISFAENVNYRNAYLFNVVFGQTTFENINYVLGKRQPISLIYRNDWNADTCELTFKNITIDSNGETVIANGENFGLFAQYTNFNISGVKYIDCVNNANLNNSGTSTGVFLGSGWFFNEGDTQKIEFTNCKNTGDITGTFYTGVLYGNGAYVGSYKGDGKITTEYSAEYFVIANVENTAKISSNLPNGKAGIAPASSLFDSNVKNSGSILVGGCFDGKTVKIDLSNANSFKFAMNGSAEGITYKVAFNINVIWNSDGTQSNTTKYFYDIQRDDSVTTNVLTKKYQANTEEFANSNGLSTASLTYDSNGIAIVVGKDATTLVFKTGALGNKTIGNEGSGTCGVSISLYAYDQNGLCVGVTNIK